MIKPEDCGKSYWCVKVIKDISEDGKIYLYAEEIRITNGDIEFLSWKGATILAIARNSWFYCFEASTITGKATSIDGRISKFQTEKRTPANERKEMTKSLRYDVLERDGFRCRLCGITGKESVLEVDHIIPVSHGGTTTFDNLQTLCRDCNAGKSNKSVLSENINKALRYEDVETKGDKRYRFFIEYIKELLAEKEYISKTELANRATENGISERVYICNLIEEAIKRNYLVQSDDGGTVSLAKTEN